MKNRHSQAAFFQSLLYSKLFLMVGVVVLTFVSITLVKGFLTRLQVSHEVNQLKSEIAELENKNKDFKTLLSYLESEEFIKQEARAKFGLKERGEQVVVLNSQSVTQKRMIDTEANSVTLSNPNKWLNYFFGHE